MIFIQSRGILWNGSPLRPVLQLRQTLEQEGRPSLNDMGRLVENSARTRAFSIYSLTGDAEVARQNRLD